MKKYWKRFLALALAVVLAFPAVSFAEEESKTTVNRIAGKNRYETSVNLSKAAFDEADEVILASGEGFADALSGSGLVSAKDAPLLLVEKDSIPAAVKEEIKRLGAKKVYVLGGLNTISEKALKDLELEKERIAGKDRYETSRKVAELIGDFETIIVASGKNFPDALTAGALVEKLNGAVLLTDGENLPGNYEDKDAYILGGTSSVSEKLASKLNAQRISGPDRYATALEAAKFAGFNKVILADGTNYPDALAAASLAREGYGILLTGQTMTDEVYEYAKDKEEVALVGGKGSVSEAVENKLLGVEPEETYLTFTNDPTKKTKAMKERDFIMMYGRFDPEMIYGISVEEFAEIEELARKQMDKTKYWDHAEFVSYIIDKRYPGHSEYFPNELAEKRWNGNPYDYIWEKNAIVGGGPPRFQPYKGYGEELLQSVTPEEMQKYYLENLELIFKDPAEQVSFNKYVELLIFEDHPELLEKYKSDNNKIGSYLAQVRNDRNRIMNNPIIGYDDNTPNPVIGLFENTLKPPAADIARKTSYRTHKEIMTDPYRKVIDTEHGILGDVVVTYMTYGYRYPNLIIDNYGNVYGYGH